MHQRCAWQRLVRWQHLVKPTLRAARNVSRVGLPRPRWGEHLALRDGRQHLVATSALSSALRNGRKAPLRGEHGRRHLRNSLCARGELRREPQHHVPIVVGHHRPKVGAAQRWPAMLLFEVGAKLLQPDKDLALLRHRGEVTRQTCLSLRKVQGDSVRAAHIDTLGGWR